MGKHTYVHASMAARTLEARGGRRNPDGRTRAETHINPRLDHQTRLRRYKCTIHVVPTQMSLTYLNRKGFQNGVGHLQPLVHDLHQVAAALVLCLEHFLE
jgi:hypothetical protein